MDLRSLFVRLADHVTMTRIKYWGSASSSTGSAGGLPSRDLLLECTFAIGPRSLQYAVQAGRRKRRTYVEVAGVEVVAGLVAHVGGDAPAGGVVNAAVDCRRLTLIDALRETRNSSERASLSDPERGHLLCPDLQSAQCRRLNIPPLTRPAAAHSPRRRGSRAWSYAEERTCCCVLFSELLCDLFKRETEHLYLRPPMHGIGCHQSMKMGGTRSRARVVYSSSILLCV